MLEFFMCFFGSLIFAKQNKYLQTLVCLRPTQQLEVRVDQIQRHMMHLMCDTTVPRVEDEPRYKACSTSTTDVVG
eukprot:4735361-Amphidinium_carterae.1